MNQGYDYSEINLIDAISKLRHVLGDSVDLDKIDRHELKFYLKRHGLLNGFNLENTIERALCENSFKAQLLKDFQAMGAQIKPQQIERRRGDAIARYDEVPLHAVFLFTSEDEGIAEYVLQNWGALDSLSGELCDIHPTVKQFENAEDAYDYINDLNVINNSGFRELSQLPGMFFWDQSREGEFVPFGQKADYYRIKMVVRTVFEELKQAPNIRAIRIAKDRLAENTKRKGPIATSRQPSLWKQMMPFLVSFVIVLAGIAVVSIRVSPFVFGPVLIGAILVLVLISIFTFRAQEGISEDSLIGMVNSVLDRLPFLRPRQKKRNPNRNISQNSR